MGKSTVNSRPWLRWPWGSLHPSEDQLIDMWLSKHEHKEANRRIAKYRFDQVWEPPQWIWTYCGSYIYDCTDTLNELREEFRNLFVKFWSEE